MYVHTCLITGFGKAFHFFTGVPLPTKGTGDRGKKVYGVRVEVPVKGDQ
jgi:hypothetical protein